MSTQFLGSAFSGCGVLPVGEALRMYRMKRRLTQAELVELLAKNANIKVDQGYISRIERDEMRPRPSRLAAICTQLDCSPDDIKGLAQQLAELVRRRDAINDRASFSTGAPDGANETLAAYQLATTAARIGIWRLDFATRDVWLSVSLRNMVDPAIVSHDWRDYVAPADQRSVRRAVLTAMRKGVGYFDCCVRLRASRGKYCMMRIIGRIEAGMHRNSLVLSGAVVPVPDNQWIAMHAIDAMRGCFVFAKNRKLQFTFVNEALVEAFGKKSKSELIGKTDAQIHPHPDEVSFFNEMDQKTIDMIDSYEGDARHAAERSHRLAINEEFLTDASGTRRVLATVKEPIIMPDNEVQIFGVARDITEIQRLKSSFEYLMDRVGDTGDVIYFKDRESRFLRANMAMAKLAGVSSPAELVNKTDHDFFPKEFADLWRREEEEVFRSKTPCVNRVCRNQMQNGSIVWRLVSKYPVIGNDGQVSELIGIAKDITELVVARDRLRFESQLLDQLMNDPKIKLCIWVKDITGRYIKSNRRFALRHGYSDPAMIIGKTDADHWPTEVARRFWDDDKYVIDNKAVKVCYQEVQRWKNGTESLILTSKLPVVDNDGAVVAVLGVYEVLQDDYQSRGVRREAAEQAKTRMNCWLHKVQGVLSNHGLCMSV